MVPDPALCDPGRCAWGACDAFRCDAPVALAVGVAHACALTSSCEVVCWGGDTGEGVFDISPAPPHARPTRVPMLSDAIQISAGRNATCALRSNGTVACWGRNAEGVLGFPEPTVITEPREVDGVDHVTAIEVRGRHACARRDDGSIVCWGRDVENELGDGGGVWFRGPTERREARFDVLGLLDHGTCAIDDGRRLWCWGDNRAGQLVERGVRDPTRIGTGTYLAFGGGNVHSCGITTEREVVCFGSDELGRTGMALPRDASALAFGIQHTCTLETTGSVVCWGFGTALGMADSTATPISVELHAPARFIAAGGNAACALLEESAVPVCWGNNSMLLLGTDAVRSASTAEPVAVRPPE